LIQRTAVICLEVLAGILLAVVIGGGVLAWRLTEGPIRLEILDTMVASALSDPEAGIETTIEGAEIAWSERNQALDLVARSVVVRDGSDEVAVTIDKVAVALSGEALMRGRVAPKRIDVIEPTVVVKRDASGSWSLTQDRGREPASPPRGAEALDLDALLRTFATGSIERQDADKAEFSALSQLLSVRIRDAKARFVDEINERSFEFSDLHVELNRSNAGLAFRGSGAVLWPGDAGSVMEAAGRFSPQDELLSVQLSLADMPPAEIARLDPRLQDASRLSAPLDLDADLVTDLDFRTVNGRVGASVGDGALDLGDRLPAPLAIREGRVDLTLSEGGEMIELDASVDVDGPVAAVQVRLARGGTGWGVLVDAAVSDLPVDDFVRVWPSDLGRGAHEWVTENLTDGNVTSATARLQGWMDGLDPESLQVDSMDGQIGFTGVTTHYFRPLPPVLGSDGSATFDRDSFDIVIQNGRLRDLRLERSTVLISNLGVDGGEIASVDVRVQGPVRDAVWVLDHEPLKYASKVGIDPDQIAGQAGVRLNLEIPLLKDLDVEEIKIGAAATMTGVTAPDVLRDIDLTDGALELDLTGLGMTLSGSAMLLGRPAEVSLEQSFVEGPGYERREQIRTTIGPEALAALDLEVDDRMRGTAAVVADSKTFWSGETLVDLEANLQDTALHLPELSWRKPQGSAGSVRATIGLRDGQPTELRAFSMAAADLAIDATAEFDAEGRITSIDVPAFRFDETRAAGRVERTDVGGWLIAMDGPVIDLTPILDASEDESGGGAGDDRALDVPLQVRFAADRLRVTEGPVIETGTLAAQVTGSRIDRLSLAGRIGKGDIMVAVRPIEGRRRLSVKASDAGEFLKAFDIVDTLSGGTLRVDGVLTGDGLEDGIEAVVQIDEFHISDAPVFAQILSLASFTGLADTLTGDGIRFTRAHAALEVSEQAVTVSKGIAYGPALGLKMAGRVPRESGSLDLVGMVAPAYSLSRLIDQIPVFGELLTGGEGEGLLATEVRITGTPEDPTVTVNPLTAIAPGFLRDLVSTAERPSDGPVNQPPPVRPGYQQPEDLGR